MPIILIILGLSLILLNVNAIKKGDNSFNSVLDNKKENLTDLEIKMGEIRKDMAESLLEIQQDILGIKDSMQVNDNNSIHKISKEKKEVTPKEEKGVINNINIKNKSERIKELLDLGFSEEEICEKLSLGKGEVQLVKGLFKK